MKVPSVFHPFMSATKAAFDYLTTEYDFCLKAQGAAGPEAWIVYENQTTRVTVHYEIGAEPWVEIGRLEVRDGEIVQPNSTGLALLLRERGQPLDDEVTVARDIGESEIAQMVSVRAARLRTVGDDLLRGDFRAFPKLQTKAEKELQSREAELFRSDT
jgi:hypothetical protein